MPLLGNPLMVWRMFGTLLFKIVRLIFNTFQSVVWQVNGTSKQVADARKPENYNRCAHVLDIRAYYKFDILHICSVKDYICTHNRFENPQYIFDNDDVTLFTINETDAIFVETEPKGLRMWSSESSPFIKYSQIVYGKKLIIIPLPAFHRMSEQLGDPKGELVFLFNTARCGSTLLTQMLEYTRQCVAVSEPDSANYIATLYRKKGDSKEVRELARDTIRWICKPTSDFQPLAYAVKIVAPAVVAVQMFHEVFPRSKFMFMYRDPVKVAKSIYKISYSWTSLRLAYILGAFSANFTEQVLDSMGFSGADFKVRLEDDMTLGMFVVVVATRYYLDFIEQGFDVAGILYEDIIADPKYACTQILKFIGMPESLADFGVKGLEQDSQRNSPISAKILGGVVEPVLTPKSKEISNRFLKKYGLPLVGEDPFLPGTITRRL